MLCCNALLPMRQGVAIGGQLLTNPSLGRSVGAAVCKFGAPTLAPVLRQVLQILGNQSTETLANLPAFTAALAAVQPETLSVSDLVLLS